MAHRQPLAHPPLGFVVNDVSFDWASDRLRRLRTPNPSAFRAIVVVEGFVQLRKYNLRQVEREVAEKKTRRPEHTFPPVVLYLQRYRSVEAK